MWNNSNRVRHVAKAVLFLCILHCNAAKPEKFDQDETDRLSLSLTPQYQAAFRAKLSNTNYQAVFAGAQTLYGGGNFDIGRGRILWYAERTETTGGTTTNELSLRASLGWPINDADAPNPENHIDILAIQQYFFEDSLQLVVGKLLFSDSFLTSPYYGDDQTTFSSSMISSDPNTNFAQIKGLGLYVQVDRNDWFIAGGMADNQANIEFDIPSLADGHFVYAIESGYRKKTDYGNENKVSILVFYSDSNRSRSEESGIVAAFTTEMGDDESWAIFGRYGWYRPAERSTSNSTWRGKNGGFIGVHTKAIFGIEDLDVGAALMAGKPSESVSNTFETTYGTEFYIRYTFADWLTFSHSEQIISSTERKFDVVSGFRLRLHHNFY
ncbi:Uncharacterised protein [BD1-7 clade bacterium]|uniref:Porin n=1 Tax=BD1-7 clade bacterium TaxID=2029982 RepID=A0A5S9QJZ6_9GAMM|nr:Uncharacterised protein [BD1-7 clade bacterium]